MTDASPLLVGMGWFPDQPGGLNRYFRELLAALPTGLDARAVVVGPATDLPRSARAVGRFDDPIAHRLRQVRAAAAALAPEADLADVHSPLYGAACRSHSGFRRLPYVVHFHGPWGAESRLEGDGRLKVAAKRRLERELVRRARRVVVLSSAFRRLLIEEHGVSPWVIEVIAPGVDLERFVPGPRAEARSALGLPPTAWIAICPRRLAARMGIDVLVGAWQRLSGDRLLLLVGGGPLGKALERSIRERGVEDTVRTVGVLSDERLALAYQAADVCVVPSRALEGFGLVVLEALASGTPVIATATGGPAETLARLDRDLLVPVGDEHALAERLEDARSGARPFPSPQACRRFAEAYSWARVAKHHERLYSEVLRPPLRTRPRVVFVNHCARMSGGEIALLRLLPELDADVHVILGEDGPLVDRLVEQAISIEVVPLGERGRDLRRAELSASLATGQAVIASAVWSLRLARRLRMVRPDVVHANSLKATVCSLIAARATNVPVVFHLRNRLSGDYLTPASARAFRAIARFPAAIIANSATTLGTVGNTSSIHAVIPSPIDPTLLTQRVDPHEPVFVLVSRLTPLKGQDLFLEAFARAFPAGGRARIVGSSLFGEDEYAAGLADRMTELGLDGRVTLTGFQAAPWSDLGPGDVAVHASLVPEPFGLSVVEAMAAGLAVVAPAAGGPTEFVEHERTGLLYEPGNADALAAALTRLAADEGLRVRLGTAARKEAAVFTPARAAAATMRVYGELLQGRMQPAGKTA